MRRALWVALLAPAFCHGKASSAEDALVGARGEELAILGSSPHASDSSISIEVPLKADGGVITFSVDLLPSSQEHNTCGNSIVQVNGNPLSLSEQTPENGWSLPSESFLTTESFDEVPLLLSLLVSHKCLGSLPLDTETQSSVLEAVSVQVSRVGEFQSQHFTGFFLLVDTATWTIVRHDLLQNIYPPAQLPSKPYLSEDFEQPQLAEVEPSVTATLDKEFKFLGSLQAELVELQELIDDQKSRVHELTHQELAGVREDISKCESIGCVFQTVYRGVKKCFRIAYLKISNPTMDKSSEKDCYWSQSNISSASLLSHDVKPSCRETKPLLNNVPLGDKKHAFVSVNVTAPDAYSDTDDEDDELEVGPTAFLFAFCGLASLALICCKCITCCSARGRAEHAARMEERRTRRQYRCLARKKRWADRKESWKNWWGGRKVGRRTTDYEEKRGLIMTQEALLEEAQQAEIRQLTAPYTNILRAAEEGRASASRPDGYSSGEEEPLPPYRSRASSAPSYRTIERRRRANSMTVGFVDYAPGSGAASPALGSEATPDSSVIGLSPRPSFETLRTERSMV